MNTQIDRIKKTRQYLIDTIKDLPVERVNKIPEGFNNNIAWNLGHLIASQQGICYVRAGAKPAVDEKYYLQYKPGTKPEQDIDDNELQQLKEILLSSIDKLEADYQTGLFNDYTSWTTRYGVAISNINDALQFLMYHEGLHAGVIGATKKIV